MAEPGTGATGPAWRELVAVLGGGLTGAAALTLLQVPAGGIIGAVLGSAVVSVRLERPRSQPVLRAVGLVLLGTAAALRLDRHTIGVIGEIIVPLVAAVLALLVLNAVLAVVLHRWFGLDPVTALLAAAPGGVSEIAVMADQLEARVPLVVAIHVVRVIAVVLVALPILISVLGP